MAEGGEGIPEYKSGQVINPGESFILKPGDVYKPPIDRDPNDLVVQDKVPTTEQQTLSRKAPITEEQEAGARNLLRDLPPNAPPADKLAAEKLLEEAIANTTPAKEADPNARAAWADAQNAKRTTPAEPRDWFGWIKKLVKKTG